MLFPSECHARGHTAEVTICNVHRYSIVILYMQDQQRAAELEVTVAAKHVEVLERAAEFQSIADRLAAVRDASIQWASRSVEHNT